jgi:FkbM family methyltransferase
VLGRIRDQLDRIRAVLPGGFARTSFAQEGEDLILARIFRGQREGIYVDVGAHHPRRFSNTELLYRSGWHGVNIDAAPGSMEMFRRLRTRDINLEMGVAATDGERDFYVFDEPALNTFDEARAKSVAKPPYHIVNVAKVRCAPLSTILRENKIGRFDLLTIDAEGYDFEILKTLDWDVNRPKVVLTEALYSNADDPYSNDVTKIVTTELHQYLGERGYRFFAKAFNSVFYLRD